MWKFPLQLHCEAPIIWHKQSQNFAEILLVRAHRQFFNKSCSFWYLPSMFKFSLLTIWNGTEVGKSSEISWRVDEQFVHVQMNNIKISAKRAHPWMGSMATSDYVYTFPRERHEKDQRKTQTTLCVNEHLQGCARFCWNFHVFHLYAHNLLVHAPRNCIWYSNLNSISSS